MNSPFVTAVVGTSSDAPRLNAPLAPATPTPIARAPTQAMIVRLLLRHMSLHEHARLQTRRDNHLVIVHRAERDGARPGAGPVHHPDRERVVAAPAFARRASVDRHDGVAGYDDDVVLPFELDVNGCREIGQQLRMAPLDADNRDE